MFIDYGCSRFVLLTQRSAIKIGRIRIWHPFIHLYRMCLSRERAWRENRLKKYDVLTSFTKALKEYLTHTVCAGIFANRQEYAISRTASGLPIAGVRSMHLGGLILIMERGIPVPEEASAAFRKPYIVDDDVCDLHQPRHVCRFPDGSLRFIDYGHPDAPRILGIS